MTSSFNGLELFLYAFKDQIKRDSDCIVVFVHWYLVKNGFVCISEGKKTEVLPSNWNAEAEIYLLDYSHSSKGYELKVLIVDDSLIINLMKKSTERTANITCIIKDHISSHKNEYQNLFMNLQDLYENMHKEFEPLFKNEEANKCPEVINSRNTKESGSVTSNPDPLRVTDPLRATDPLRIIDPLRTRPPLGPDNIGRSDLDPFSRFDPTGGSGMIFDPFRNMDQRLIPTNLPRGAIPPGARFDPYGPPNPDDILTGSSTRVGPNPNHLRKPEFDDMFM